LVLNFSACDNTLQHEAGSDANGHTAPSAVTIKVNQAVLDKRPFSNIEDLEDAKKGLIAQDKSLIATDNDGKIIWDMPSYGFVDFKGQYGAAPSSVNPSLWHQASLNNIHGLFRVSEGIYQLRGYDLANMTIIEGASGWILVDPLTAKETANKALNIA
jgi:alkyl sulfatase BDS1-like metallo-beta-lactamase superfamily hydrolase